VGVAVEDPPLVLDSGHGGMPARRAVVRWAWRLFRREWRQQSIVPALLLISVAATTVGLGIAVHASEDGYVFGTADHLVTLSTTGPELEAHIAKLVRHRGRDRTRKNDPAARLGERRGPAGPGPGWAVRAGRPSGLTRGTGRKVRTR
jgi:hypothetical protein